MEQYDGIDYKGHKYKKYEPLLWQQKYVNQRFGKLVLECPVEVEGKVTKPNDSRAIWLTHCDCGNDYCVTIAILRKNLKEQKESSCGCIQRAIQDDKYIGKTYNLLTVLERDEEYKKQGNFSNANTYYKCRCACGNITHVRINSLIHGDVKSCGCLKEAQDKINLTPMKMHDLTGQRFGKLVALAPFYKENDSNTWWHCQCDCGNIHDVRGYSLVNGDTTSCGCLLKSKGETQIEHILKENNINFLFDTEYFKDLILPTGGIGRYDFILLNEDNEPFRLIEYDGQQHFIANKFFGGKEGLKNRQISDKVKNIYALQHNLPLVRIPYTVSEITLDILLGDDFLVKGDIE